MALDFHKLGTGQSVDTVLSPREIFNALPSKTSAKFPYPRDVQSQVWSKWFSRKQTPNLVLKMNTGAGKTLVGLLILKSCLNEKKGPAVYVVPDNYLVLQVVSEAKALGIEVVIDPRDSRYLSGKAILIVNIHKVINGKSVFGVGDEGIKLPITSIIIDDAHACLDSIDEQFSINISRSNPAFDSIYQVFREPLKQQCESKLIEIETEDPQAYIQVPYWHWQEKISQVVQALVDNKEHSEIKFSWPLIKENLSRCSCVISGSGIEISSACIPIDSIPSISSAQRKIFMTATLADDSILATHFGVGNQYLNDPITPDTAGDVGDRLIMLPQGLNTEMYDDDIKKLCHDISKTHNVVVIVPSKFRADYWSDISSLTMDKDTIYDGVARLKSEHVGLAVLINRYDGIDLPESACRLLVIDGLPNSRSKIDKIRQNELSGSSYQFNEAIHTIEQGMGRGVRSNDDYCVVFLMGKDLTSRIYIGGASELFSPATKAQLDLSEQIGYQLQEKGVDELKTAINYCLNRDPEWIRTSRGVLASLSYEGSNKTDSVNVALREAYDLDRQTQPRDSVIRLQQEINLVDCPILKAILKQVMAEYVNKYDPVEAQRLQLSAVSKNPRLVKPMGGISYKPLVTTNNSQAVLCSEYLAHKYTDGNKLIIDVEGILSNLLFIKDSSNRFEKAIDDLAPILGFKGQRPENDYKKGPDNLWDLGGLQFLVIECKNEVTSGGFINKHDCNQLNGSEIWFSNAYSNGATSTPIMVHPSTCFEYACSPNNKVRIMNEELLGYFVNNIRVFVKTIANDKKFIDVRTVEQNLAHYKLTSRDIVSTYTTTYSVKTG